MDKYVHEVTKWLDKYKYSYEIKYIEKIIKKHFEEKQWIKETFFEKEKDKIIFPSSQTPKYILDFLTSLTFIDPELKVKDSKYFLKKGNPIKATKVISNNWDVLQKTQEYSFEFICAEFSAHARANFTKYEEGDLDLNKFLILYGDITTQDSFVVISIDPMDYFNISTGSAFTSCLSYEGCYNNTILHYLASDCVVVTYTIKEARPNYKIGRSIFYVSPSYVIQSRVYGSYYKDDLTKVRHYLQEKIGGNWIKKSHTIQEEIISHSNNSAYVDYGYGVVSIKKDNFPEQLIIKTGMCPSCGNSLAFQDQGLHCEDCYEEMEYNTCSSCGNRIEENDEYCFHDEIYCEDCYNDIVGTCGKCEENVLYEDMTEVRIMNGKYSVTELWCEYCNENYADDCCCCGETWGEDDLFSVEEDKICPNCLESEKVIDCENCGDAFYTKNMKLVKGHYYCEDCYTEPLEEAV